MSDVTGFDYLLSGRRSVASLEEEVLRLRTALAEKVKKPGVVQVGVGVFLLGSKLIDGRVTPTFWLGLRTGAHGADTWGLPGGKPEMFEALTRCCCREAKEETSVDVDEESLTPLCWVDSQFPDNGLHFATLFYVASVWRGLPKVTSDAKHLDWKEFSIDDLPPNVFAGLKKATEKLRETLKP